MPADGSLSAPEAPLSTPALGAAARHAPHHRQATRLPPFKSFRRLSALALGRQLHEHPELFLPDTVIGRSLSGELLTDGDEPQQFPFSAAILLADISGFTSLASSLLQGRDEAAGAGPPPEGYDATEAALRGTDELSRRLNEMFRELLRKSRAYGGDCLRFLGDALLIVIPSPPEDGEVGLAAAAFRAFCLARELLDVEAQSLRMHVALTAGHLALLKVGGQRGRWEIPVVGKPLDSLGTAISKAPPGSLAIAPEGIALLRAAPSLRGHWGIAPGEGGFLVLSAIGMDERFGAGVLRNAPELPPPALSPGAYRRGSTLPSADATPLPRSKLYPLLPSDVEAAIRGSDGAVLMTELRLITAMFIKLPAFDVPQSGAVAQGTLDRIHRSVRAVQQAAERTEGVLRSFFRDDKGPVALLTWGLVSSAHEDDPQRACVAALRVKAAFQRDALGPLSIGIATGRVFCGLLGDEVRCDFNVLGDSVNVAARLMSAAEGGAVLLDRATGDAAMAAFETAELPPIAVKGKDKPVEVSRLLRRRSVSMGRLAFSALKAPRDEDQAEFGPPAESTTDTEAAAAGRPSADSARQLHPGTALALSARLRKEALSEASHVRGREEAVATTCDFLTQVVWKPGGAGTLLILGEAGMGKTALASEAMRLAEAAGVPVLSVCADPFASRRPYCVFLHLLRTLVGMAPGPGEPAGMGVAVNRGLPSGPAAPDANTSGLAPQFRLRARSQTFKTPYELRALLRLPPTDLPKRNSIAAGGAASEPEQRPQAPPAASTRHAEEGVTWTVVHEVAAGPHGAVPSATGSHRPSLAMIDRNASVVRGARASMDASVHHVLHAAARTLSVSKERGGEEDDEAEGGDEGLSDRSSLSDYPLARTISEYPPSQQTSPPTGPQPHPPRQPSLLERAPSSHQSPPLAPRAPPAFPNVELGASYPPQQPAPSSPRRPASSVELQLGMSYPPQPASPRRAAAEQQQQPAASSPRRPPSKPVLVEQPSSPRRHDLRRQASAAAAQRRRERRGSAQGNPPADDAESRRGSFAIPGRPVFLQADSRRESLQQYTSGGSRRSSFGESRRGSAAVERPGALPRIMSMSDAEAGDSTHGGSAMTMAEALPPAHPAPEPPPATSQPVNRRASLEVPVHLPGTRSGSVSRTPQSGSMQRTPQSGSLQRTPGSGRRRLSSARQLSAVHGLSLTFDGSRVTLGHRPAPAVTVSAQLTSASPPRSFPGSLVRSRSAFQPSRPGAAADDTGPLARLLRFLSSLDPELSTLANALLLDKLLKLSGGEETFATPSTPGMTGADSTSSGRLSNTDAAHILLSSIFKTLLRTSRAVLVAEDLHLLDSASLRLVQNLAYANGTSVIASARATATPDLKVLSRCGRARNLTLGPLDEQDAAAIAGRELGVSPDAVPAWFSAALSAKARGNAFVLLELLRYMQRQGLVTPHPELDKVSFHPSVKPDAANSLPVPETVERLVTSQLELLAHRSALVCKLCSIFGARFSLGMAATVLEDDVDPRSVSRALQELEAADLVRPVDGDEGAGGGIAGTPGDREFAFAQSIVQSVLYRLLSAADKERLHRKAADWLEARATPARRGALANVLSYHLLQCGERERAVAYLDLAAAEALESGAYAETVDIARQTLALIPVPPPLNGPAEPTRPSALARAFRCRRVHALDPYEHRRAVADRARRLVTMAHAQGALGHLSDLRTTLHGCLALLGTAAPAGEVPAAALAARLVALALRGPPRLDRRSRPARPPLSASLSALSPGSRDGAELRRELCALTAQALMQYSALAQQSGDWLRALHCAALTAHVTAGDPYSCEFAEGCTLVAHAVALLPAGPLRRRADPWLARAAEIADTEAGRGALGFLLVAQARQLIAAGDLHEAECLCRVAAEELRSKQQFRHASELMALLPLVAHARGAFEEADAAYLSVVDLARKTSNRVHLVWGLLGRAAALVRRGDCSEEVDGCVQEARRALPDGTAQLPTAELYIHAVRACARWARGERPEAVRLIIKAVAALHRHRAAPAFGRVIELHAVLQPVLLLADLLADVVASNIVATGELPAILLAGRKRSSLLSLVSRRLSGLASAAGEEASATLNTKGVPPPPPKEKEEEKGRPRPVLQPRSSKRLSASFGTLHVELVSMLAADKAGSDTERETGPGTRASLRAMRSFRSDHSNRSRQSSRSRAASPELEDGAKPPQRLDAPAALRECTAVLRDAAARVARGGSLLRPFAMYAEARAAHALKTRPDAAVAAQLRRTAQEASRLGLRHCEALALWRLAQLSPDGAERAKSQRVAEGLFRRLGACPPPPESSLEAGARKESEAQAAVLAAAAGASSHSGRRSSGKRGSTISFMDEPRGVPGLPGPVLLQR